VTTLTWMQQALQRLSLADRQAVTDWLREFTQLQYEVREPRYAYLSVHPPFMTLEEYLQFESDSAFRHEYVNGSIYPMSSATTAHARITRELFCAVDNHLQGGACQAFSVNLRLLIQTDCDAVVYYPDLMVIGEGEQWGAGARGGHTGARGGYTGTPAPSAAALNYVTNPTLVAETVAAQTLHIDRREKGIMYRRVPSLEEYVLVAQNEHRVLVHRRGENWQPQAYEGPDAVAEFRSIGLSLPLARLYQGSL
jgi:Uma2 family endonuclease